LGRARLGSRSQNAADLGLRRCRLGLERFQGAQRAPQLGERAAAIAQQRVEGAGIVAVANQGETEAVAGEQVLGEQLGLLGRRVGERGPNPVPAAKRSARARRQLAATTRCASTAWSAPSGASSASNSTSKASKAAACSPGSTMHCWARMPCFSAFCAERALPSGVFGSRDLAPLRRLAAARGGERQMSMAMSSMMGESGRPSGDASVRDNRNKIKIRW
jgi:hypothetical protein